MFKEFKEFIARGNVMELAVGLILATYFGAIVDSFVNDILMPPIGQAIAGVDFSQLAYQIGTTTLEDGTVEAVTINYGNFINSIIVFLIVAWAVFMIVKAYNNFLKKQAAEPDPEPPAPTKEEVLLMEIRDALRNR